MLGSLGCMAGILILSLSVLGGEEDSVKTAVVTTNSSGKIVTQEEKS